MSAFVCSAETLAVVAQRLTAEFNKDVQDGMSAADFAENMLKLNLKSVGFRYNETPAQACKSFTGKNMKEYTRQVRALAERQDTVNFSKIVGPGRVWGAVSCFLYQSCEHNGAEKNVTYKTVQSFGTLLEAQCTNSRIAREGWDF